MVDLSIFTSNLPATIATFAASVTAFFAALKFYSDKAAKVTDFRKAWIETLRLAVAEFSGHTHTIAGRIAIRKRHEGTTLTAPSESEKPQEWGAFLGRPKAVKPPFDKGFETELLGHWSGLRLSYNKIVLHLNPAEHGAYTRAEEAIVAYTRKLKESEEVRSEVVTFLHWCIHHADQTNRALMKKKAKFYQWSWWKRTHPEISQVTTDVTGPCLSFECAQNDIMALCKDAGSCLLLSAFATRQLLHGSYEQVHENVSKIERGIRSVDTAAAIVIKGVWEAIKRGEPLYRYASLAGLLASAALIGSILFALYSGASPPGKVREFDASCNVLTQATAGTGVVGTNPSTQKLSCRATMLP